VWFFGIIVYLAYFIDNYRYLGLYSFLHGEFVPNPLNIKVIIGAMLITGGTIIYVIVLWHLSSFGFPISIILTCGIVVFSVIWISHSYYMENAIVSIQHKLEEEHTVIHACGAIHGDDGEEYTYVNCLEPLQNSIDHGNHYIEVDFDKTIDDKLVCAHYLHADISEHDYLQGKEYDQFTRMNLDMLADVLLENPEVYIVTDIKGDYNFEGCRKIANMYPELRDNFIIQVYHDSEYEPIRKLGFKYIILTLYGTDIWEREISELRKNFAAHDYLGITFGSSGMSVVS